MYYQKEEIIPMQTPAAIVWLFKYLGLPGIIIGIFADFDWTKLGVSFWIGIPVAVVRIGFYISEQLDKRDARKLKYQRDKWEFEQEKKHRRNENY